jgi:hypothetical protein
MMRCAVIELPQGRNRSGLDDGLRGIVASECPDRVAWRRASEAPRQFCSGDMAATWACSSASLALYPAS